MKKLLSLLCAACLALSLAACGAEGKDYSNQTVTGRVTAVDGTKVTLQLGELSETNADGQMPNMGGDGQQPPQIPNGEQQGDNWQPPELPDGTQQSDDWQPPELPDGAQQGDGQQPPELPDGTQQGDGQQPPECRTAANSRATTDSLPNYRTGMATVCPAG